MSWLLILPLALAAFALAAFSFRLERRLWGALLGALALGLAGYALQSRPDLSGAPRQASGGNRDAQWGAVEERMDMIAPRFRSGGDRLLIADALSRRGQFANAAVMLRGAVQEDPGNGEAWLALGNALVEHAEGVLTPAALFAYRRAAAASPGSPAPGYFLGLALIRQGAILEARQVWQATLANAADDDQPRALLAQRLARLDALLAQSAPPPPGSIDVPQTGP